MVCHYFWVDVIPLLQNYDVQALRCCHHHLSEEDAMMRMHYYIIIDGVYAAMLWLLILQISSCWSCTLYYLCTNDFLSLSRPCFVRGYL